MSASSDLKLGLLNFIKEVCDEVSGDLDAAVLAASLNRDGITSIELLTALATSSHWATFPMNMGVRLVLEKKFGLSNKSKAAAGSVRALLQRAMKEEPIDEAVFDNMLYYYSTVVNSALIDNNSGVALRCYNDTKARPHTSTVQGLARKGVRVDTSTYTGHSRVLYAFRDSLPLVVKMVSNEDERLRIDAYLDLKLSHPHIVPVEKVDCHGSVTYYAMPRATTTAAGLIKPITDAVTAKLLTDIMSALEYLHEHGVAHMDIKPDNLGIDVDGNFQLIDLGSLSECGALTDVTEAFVPLEVDATRGQLRAGTEADFWALAITVVKLRGGSKSRYSKQQIRDALLDYGVQGLTIVASLLSKLVAKG